MAACRGLERVARGQSVLGARRQAARLSDTERPQPELQHECIVHDKSRVHIGR